MLVLSNINSKRWLMGRLVNIFIFLKIRTLFRETNMERQFSVTK